MINALMISGRPSRATFQDAPFREIFSAVRRNSGHEKRRRLPVSLYAWSVFNQ